MSKAYLDYFKEIAEIPHGSGNTAQIRDYCVAFAKAHNLDYYTDELNNVVIRKPATQGFEAHDTVVLQGHLDMVCEKDPDIEFDFTKDALKLRTEGDFLMATGTTLGGDDGIAVAMMLSILASDSVQHPPLECVFTTDEETGMYGAAALDPKQVKGRKLINIDSEDEGIFTVGCAGGASCEVILTAGEDDVCDLGNADNACDTECFDKNSTVPVEITVSGLIGGHSGVEINKGRQNSNVVLFGLLSKMIDKGFKFSLCKMNGGSKDNVITNNTTCVVWFGKESFGEDSALNDSCEISEVISTLNDLAQGYVREVRVDTDPGLKIEVKDLSVDAMNNLSDEYSKVLSYDFTKTVVSMLCEYPNGIQKMSEDIDDLPQTSLNFAVVSLEEGTLILRFSVRSSVTQEKLDLVSKLENISKKYGASFASDGDYPAWEFRKDSRLRDTMVSVFEMMYGKPPKVEVIHAGLECGLLSEKLEGLDAVSIGPDLFDIHSPKERLSLLSAERVYEFVLKVLKEL